MQKYLDCALGASYVAEEIIRNHYHEKHFSITMKQDNTPVTEVDVICEKAIFNYIKHLFPDHGFYGEEEGRKESDSDYLWLVDPIDGTKAFVRGRPFFSCQIALMYKDELVLGVSTAPCYNQGERAYALKGHGAFLNDKRISVSDIAELSEAVLSSGNIKSLASDKGLWMRYAEIVRQVNSTRGFGDFLHYHLLASGSIDLVMESDVSILDVAALSVIVAEAGGMITDLNGLPLSLESRSILAANPRLHENILTII